jgi:hypothetical protein
VLYVRERWTEVFEAGAQPPSTSRTHGVEVPLAAAAAIVAVAVGGLMLFVIAEREAAVPPPVVTG